MELDKRIKEGKRPLTCLDIEQAREFVGKECIFSDNYDNYRDIEKYNIDNNNDYTAILSIDDDTSNGDYVFENPKIKSRYRLILPLEWVKKPEKKYRPYSLEEFLEIFDVGDQIEFRYKDTDDVKHAMFTGYITDVERIDDKTPGACEIMLGIFHYSLLDLFKDFERFYNGRWWPFGVEVEENE